MFVFFFKQKTAYEMRISDWSSDVCSSDLVARLDPLAVREVTEMRAALEVLALRHAVQRMTAESLAAAHQALLDSTTAADIVALSSEARRVGKGCVSTCSSRRSPYHLKKNKQTTTAGKYQQIMKNYNDKK